MAIRLYLWGRGFGGSTPGLHEVADPQSYLQKCLGVDWNLLDPLASLELALCLCEPEYRAECSLHRFTLYWCDFQVPKCTKFKFLAPNPLGELTALPRPRSWWGGDRCPLPALGPSGLALRRPPLLKFGKYSPDGSCVTHLSGDLRHILRPDRRGPPLKI